jgi:hypothetical protein
MHPELQRCLTLLDAATAGLDEAAAGTRVDGRWSVAEIVEHLDRTYTGTTKGFERCLEAGMPRASAPTMRSRIRVFTVVTLGYFPSGIEAPKHVVPTGRVSLPEVMEKVRAHLQALDGAAAATEARLGSGPVMDHPILGPFTVAQWMRFHRIHTHHHQKQILERRTRLASLA